MPADLITKPRGELKFRVDQPEVDHEWPSSWSRPLVVALGVVFVLFGAGNLELGPDEARLGMASGELPGPLGRVFGYWDPSLWPASVAIGQLWAAFEELGPTQNAVRWPAAIAGLLLGLLLARRARLAIGPRASWIVALAWFGSVGLMDRSSATGLDLVAGLGTVAALDRLLSRGSGWVVGFWACLAFLAAGWPPVAMLGLITVVLGRPGSGWSWRIAIPVALTAAGWSAWALANVPAEAWASAMALPITQASAWGLAMTAVGLGLPWAPFAILASHRTIREGWAEPGRSLVLGWLKVVGACLIVGTLVPGMAGAALVPALAGLAVVSAGCWDRIWEDAQELPAAVTRRACQICLGLNGLWLVLVLGWGGTIGFAVAYYRATIIVVALISGGATLMAIRSLRLGHPRWALGSLIAVSLALKLAHWGYYVPESNYRAGEGPWGRAIGQWVPEKHPIFVLHTWPADLAFATGRPFRQLPTPLHLDYQPEPGSKFVLLQDSEFVEYESWSNGWPKLLKVAEFEDELGLGKRFLMRTDAPLIVRRPFQKHDPVAEASVD